MSTKREWRWVEPSGATRRATLGELRAGIAAGIIPANAPIWRKGWDDWIPAHSVPELLGVEGVETEAVEVEQNPAAVEPPAPPTYVPASIGKSWDTPRHGGPAATMVGIPALDARGIAALVQRERALQQRTTTPQPPAAQVAEELSSSALVEATSQPPNETPVPPQRTPPPVERRNSSLVPRLPTRASSAVRAARMVVAPVEELSASNLVDAQTPDGVPSVEPSPPARPTSQAPPGSSRPPSLSAEGRERPPPLKAVPSHTLRPAFHPPEASPGAPVIGAAPPLPPTVPRAIEVDASRASRPSDSLRDTVRDVQALERAQASSRSTPPEAPELAAPEPPLPATGEPKVSATGTILGVQSPVANRRTSKDPRDVDDEITSPDLDLDGVIPGLRQRRRGAGASLPRGAVIGAGALVVVVGALGLLMARSGRDSTASTLPAETPSNALDPEGARAPKPTPESTTAPAIEKPPTPLPCTTFAPSRELAGKVAIPSIEVVATTATNPIDVGVVAAKSELLAFAVDPALGNPELAARARSPGSYRAVPERGAKVKVLGDPTSGGPLAGRRIVSGSPPLDFGIAGGWFAFATRSKNTVIKLWPAEGAAPPEAARVAVAHRGSSEGIAVVFRRDNAIHLGAAQGDPLAPVGTLVRVPGLGPQVGSPAIAAAGEVVLAVWADRPSTDVPWQLRMARWVPGGPAPEVRLFDSPPGGLGGQAMAPSVSSIGADRFLLVWTEGPISSHQVRAQTLDVSMHPLGPPLVLSAVGKNAGQAQVAIRPDGRGVAAFIEANGDAYDAVFTQVSCP